jgi:hypothetical protein
VHSRIGDADLTGDQIVEITEHPEEHEEVPEEAGEASQLGEDETALTDLDEVVDAAVASVQREQESDADRER